jgi:NifU-like protein involved in Fe-S cluster formation
MVTDAMRRVMRAAVGAGELDGAGVREASGEHPVCGDELRLTCTLAGGRITALAWQARGCPATAAVAAVGHQALLGEPAASAAELLRGALEELGGLAATERHAEALFLRVLREAVSA